MNEKIYKVKRKTLVLAYSAIALFIILAVTNSYYAVEHFIKKGLCGHSLFLILCTLGLYGANYVLYINYKRSVRNCYQFENKCLKVLNKNKVQKIFPEDIGDVHYGLKSCKIILKNNMRFYLSDEQEDLQGFKLRMQRFYVEKARLRPPGIVTYS